MSRIPARKSLTLAAVLTTSVGMAAGAIGTAGATTYGGVGLPNPVTILTGTTVQIVGGGTVTLPAGSRDVSWSGQGGRLAYVAADNSVWTADYDGTHAIMIAAATGTARSHTVWDEYNDSVLWTEGTGTSADVLQALANGNYVTWGQAPLPALAANSLQSGSGRSAADVAADSAFSTVYVKTSNGGAATAIEIQSYSNGAWQTVAIPALVGSTTAVDQPTISPDGKTVVFVTAGTAPVKQLFSSTRNPDGSWAAPVQTTFGTADHTAPIFETDGKTVAFSLTDAKTPANSGTYSVNITAATPAGTPTANAETRIGGVGSSVSVRVDAKVGLTRFAGVDRFDTAVRASRALWPDAKAATGYKAKSVTLSRSDLPADALGGAGLATHKGGPLLLTATAALTPATLAEIQRILPIGGTVYLLGGNSAISPAVQTSLTALGYSVQRIAGPDRYSTAVAIANATSAQPTQVLVATGVNFPDALSAGAVAASQADTVVVLTEAGVMPSATAAYINANNPGVRPTMGLFAIGGQAQTALQSAGWATAQWNFTPLVGADRFQTSYLVAQAMFGTMQAVGVATGYNWPDALAGGSFMGAIHGPLLLVDPAAGLTPAENTLLDSDRGAINGAYVFGGANALPTSVDHQLAADIATATGVQTGNGPAGAHQPAGSTSARAAAVRAGGTKAASVNGFTK